MICYTLRSIVLWTGCSAFASSIIIRFNRHTIKHAKCAQVSDQFCCITSYSCKTDWPCSLQIIPWSQEQRQSQKQVAKQKRRSLLLGIVWQYHAIPMYNHDLPPILQYGYCKKVYIRNSSDHFCLVSYSLAALLRRRCREIVLQILNL